MKKLGLQLLLVFTFSIFSISLNFNETSGYKDVEQESSSNHFDFSIADSNSFAFINSRVVRITIYNSIYNSKELIDNYFERIYDKIDSNDFLYQRCNQNNKYIKNCLINYRKSDLIFPFHYYW